MVLREDLSSPCPAEPTLGFMAIVEVGGYELELDRVVPHVQVHDLGSSMLVMQGPWPPQNRCHPYDRSHPRAGRSRSEEIWSTNFQELMHKSFSWGRHSLWCQQE